MEFFISQPGATGVGEMYLGSVTSQTSSNGTTTASVTFNLPISTGVITATVTDQSEGNTSAFSNSVATTVASSFAPPVIHLP